MPSATKKGLTTIVWGTDGRLGSPNAAIVESLTITPKNAAPIEIEDNNGFTVSQVILDDGFDVVANCLYDTAKTWPAVGGNCNITNLSNTAFLCLVNAVPKHTLGRKKEAMIEVSLSYRPGVANI